MGRYDTSSGPKGWFSWTIWQYSEKGRLNGINANVDLDLFNGTLEDLYKFAGAKMLTETPKVPQKHTVAAGDSFESIANKYGVTIRELINANPQLLKSGDALTVPVAVSIPAESANNSGGTASGSKTYTVKSGDSLYVIAVKYGTTVAAIASLNNISNPDNIKVDQILNIP